MSSQSISLPRPFAAKWIISGREDLTWFIGPVLVSYAVLAMMAAGVLDPSPLVTHHMALEDAPEAYAVYDRREALKIVLTP